MAFGFWVHLVMGFLTVGFQSEYHRVVFLGFTDNNLHDAAGHVFFVCRNPGSGRHGPGDAQGGLVPTPQNRVR